MHNVAQRPSAVDGLVPKAPLDAKGAAQYLGLSTSYLNRLRVDGGSPPYAKLGRRVVYFIDDLDTWLADKKRTSTSQVGG
jgi:predicted DNA-binding transcriptional regulator AlpA